MRDDMGRNRLSIGWDTSRWKNNEVRWEEELSNNKRQRAIAFASRWAYWYSPAQGDEVSLQGVPEKFARNTRRYPRISLPKGMPVSWYGADLQLFSRVKTLGMGGLFISTPNPPPVGTQLRLAFEVPGGSVRADAVVRNIAAAEGFGVEFTRMAVGDRILLKKLMNRLLRVIVWRGRFSQADSSLPLIC
jgi:PilZ domain